MKTTSLLLLLARLPVLALLLLAGMFVAPTPARADTTSCTVISAFPYKITVPGQYCVMQSRSVNSATCCSAPAIQIAAANVTLDCNGFSVSNYPSNAARNGLLSSFDDVTVRNCTFKDFARGIVVQGGKRVRLQDNTILRAQVLGITVTATSAFVLDNRVIDTVGCQGIYALAGSKGNVMVNGNVIHGLDCASGAPTGIVVAGNGRSFVQENRLDGFGVAGVTAQSFGVLISTGSGVYVPALVDGNHFYAMNSTTHYAIAKTSTAQKGRCSDNVSPGISTNNSGCL
jgi:hypothetical protein